MIFELTNEELEILQDVLVNDIEGLRSEILHTDTREYRNLLRHKEQILEKIAAKLPKQDLEHQALAR